jgi:hypothetical protein
MVVKRYAMERRALPSNRPLPSEGKGHTFESCRVCAKITRHFRNLGLYGE